MARTTKPKPNPKWAKIDLHIHTPASTSCYQQKQVQFIDILRTAQEKGLDAIAITDHNSVAGIAAFRRRLETLQFLQEQGRLSEQEQVELDEYYGILEKVLILPGFEFTATLGFHILGIFPPQTSIRKLEHILLELNIPEDRLDQGNSEIGATTDVLSAYSILDRAGALVIAAHANSTHGVAMQNFNFGGQTKISYTQDTHLHALEVTDLASRSRRATAFFYSGKKPEYPRRMHCIQGSDAHRLNRDPDDRTSGFGIGDRCTEILLGSVTFEAIREVLTGTDFSKTRPSKAVEPFDPVREAQTEGANVTTSFHERAQLRSKGYENILRDIVAFANTNGGTIYVGAGATKGVIRGVEQPEDTLVDLQREVAASISPQVQLDIEVLTSGSKSVLVVKVPKGTDTPYVLAPGQVLVRRDSESTMAARDEIVHLVLQTLAENRLPVPVEHDSTPQPAMVSVEAATDVQPPTTGVEIVDTQERNGIKYHTVKDLRNGSVVENVTRFSARRLWRYAISECESQPLDISAVDWQGDIGLWSVYRYGGEQRYNLVQRDSNGKVHVYYGVTTDGMDGAWQSFASSEAGEVPQMERPQERASAAQ